MIHVLSNKEYEGYEAIREVARARALLAFDFDGTLAPMVDDPADARVGDHTRALLRAAALLFPCAVISGRARADLAARLARVPLLAIVGNHGAERGTAPPPGDVRAQVQAWASALRAAVGGDGVVVEDKGFTVAVHYRMARDAAEARSRIVQLASVLPGARVFGGHAVVNLAPVGAATKADAMASLAAQFPPWPVLFVGDDDTDEDAFRSRVVSHPIRVGWSERSAARYYLENQAEVDRLLWMLVAERARVANLGEGWQELDPARNIGGVE